MSSPWPRAPRCAMRPAAVSGRFFTLYAAVLAGICLHDACSCHAITEWKRPGAAAVPSDPANASLLSPAGGARCAGGGGQAQGGDQGAALDASWRARLPGLTGIFPMV
eukprot:COSAG01_NODE_2985_length_6752_cov_133.017736_8_plen_108_part_00